MKNEQLFDHLAENYDSAETRYLSKVASTAIRKVLGETEKQTAMDFGCGTGLVGLELIDSFRSIHFIDASHKMIAQVESKIKDRRLTNATTHCVDLELDNQLSSHADVIFMSLVLHHISDRQKVVTKLFDLLNAGGELIIIDINKEESDKAELKHSPHNTIDKNELIDLLTDIGFSISETSSILVDEEIMKKSIKSLFIIKATK